MEPEETEYRVTVRGPKQRQPEDDPNRPLNHPERVSAYIQGGLLFGAACLAGLQLWQLCEFRRSLELTKQQIEISRDAIVVDHRAWVLVDENPKVEGGIPLPRDGKRIEIRFKNTGGTPATNVYVSTNLIFLPEKGSKFPAAPHYREAGDNQGVIGPGQWISVSNAPEPPIPNQVWDAIERGDFKLFHYGWVQYWDEFGVERGLLYCSEYNWRAKVFSYCGVHNLPW